MSGDHLRDAISARADGEDPGVPDDVIDAHLAECPECRAFSDATHGLRRRLKVREVTGSADLSGRVVANVAGEDRRRGSAAVRWLLAVVAVVIVVQSVPDFLSTSSESHSLRHLGAFSVAYGVGLIVVVLRPARARTMLHVAVVLVAALAATATVDVVRGNVSLLGETVHLMEVASAVLLWLLARPQPDTRWTRAGQEPTGDGRPASLHVVADDPGQRR